MWNVLEKTTLSLCYNDFFIIDRMLGGILLVFGKN